MLNTLKNKLKSVKLGGGPLQSVTGEELRSLSDTAGRVSPPTSPLEAGVVGASPDSAKMAGTNSQKTAALRQAIQGASKLEDQQRAEQTRTQASAEEQAKKQQAGQLGQLGGLRDRVQALTSNILNQAGTAQLAQTLSLSEQALASLTPEQEPAVRQALATLQTDPSNQQALLTLNNSLGKTTVEEMLPADQLKAFFLGTQESTAQQVAQNTQDNISVADLDLPSLGFNSPEELANLLGVDPAQLQGLTIKQLKQDIEGKIQDEFTQIQDLEKKATDPMLGAAERAEARKQLREMGAVGIRKVESDVDKLADQIANADTVEFDGEDIAVSDLLEDEYISGLTAKYLDQNTDPQWKADFKSRNPDLAKWIDDNQVALLDAVADIDDSIKQFADTQEKNMQLAEPATGQPALPKELMQKLIPDFGKLSAEQLNVDNIPILKFMNQEENLKEAANAYDALKTLYQYDPDLVSELAGMDEGMLRSLGVLQNTDRWQNYTRYLSDYNRVKNMDPTNEESVWSAVFGKQIPAADAKSLVDEALVREKSGLFGSSPINSIGNLFKDARGNAADFQTISQRLQASLLGPDGKPLSLAGYAAGETPVTSIADKLSGINNYLRQPDKTGLYESVRTFFFNDDKIDANEAKKIPVERMEEAYTSLRNKMDDNARTQIENQYYNKTAKDISNTLINERQVDLLSLEKMADKYGFDSSYLARNQDTDLKNLKTAQTWLKEQIKSASPLEQITLKKHLNNINQLTEKINDTKFIKQNFGNFEWRDDQYFQWKNVPVVQQFLRLKDTPQGGQYLEDVKRLNDLINKHGAKEVFKGLNVPTSEQFNKLVNDYTKQIQQVIKLYG
jgi:hypothetical protein